MRIRTQQLVFLTMIVVFLGGCSDFEAFFHSEDKAEEHVSQAKLLMEQGDLAAALEELTKAIEAYPAYAPALITMGDIYRHKGDYDQARVNYEAACDADPYAFLPHYNLGVTYQALAELAQSPQMSQEYLQEAVFVYIRTIALKPRSFDANLNIGACYFQLGKLNQAEQTTRQALQIDPRSPKANNNLGAICESKGDYDQAIHAYKTSIEIDARQGNILLNLGTLYMRGEKMNSAFYAFRTAAELSPQDAAPWRRMGTCLFRMKKLDEAVRAFQQAIRLDTSNPQAYRGIGVICMYQFLIDSTRTDLRDRALQAWRFSLELQPYQEDLAQLIDRYETPETKLAARTIKLPPTTLAAEIRPVVNKPKPAAKPVVEKVAKTPVKTIETRPIAIPVVENVVKTPIKTIETRPIAIPVVEKVVKTSIKPIETRPVSIPVVVKVVKPAIKPIETRPAPAPVKTRPTAPPVRPVETKPVPVTKPLAKPTETKPATTPIEPGRLTFKSWTEPPRLSQVIPELATKSL